MNAKMRARARKRLNIFVPTSSMGDIAFLLIIFFMLTSKFMQESHVHHVDARSPDIEKVDDAPVSVILDDEGRMWLMGKECYTAEELRLGVESILEGKKDLPVMVKIDKDLTGDKYSEVLVALGKTGAKLVLTGAKSDTYAD